ncbi:MAG: glycoside hydrolase family 38 C-terminal domain-containing protein [Candidatus Aquilonibacter sp.]
MISRRTFIAAAIAGAALPSVAKAQTRRVYLASYSHIDAEWRWPLQEGLQQSDATFRSVLRVLDTFGQLKFSETSASYYAWVRTTDPSTFERIAAMVKRGNWEPVGGFWTEPDVNIVSGESLMRQAWYGQREFRDHLGVATKVAFLPDSFGSSANLPAILRAAGFQFYVMGRGTFDGKAPPQGAFVWASLGDASILTYNNPVSGGADDPVSAVKSATALADDLLVWFGLGDHGGGPTIQSVSALLAFLRAPDAPAVTFSTFDAYFSSLPATSVSRRGEMEGVFPGAFTNAYDVKRSTIDAERALLDCERYDVLAALCGIARPIPDLDELWQTLLLNQHHDTISATNLEQNVAQTVAQNRAVADRASAHAAVYLESIVDLIPHIPSDDASLVVFNPLAHPVRTVIDYPFSIPDGRIPAIFDSNGATVPAQLIAGEDAIYSNQNARTSFVADLPAFGYVAYRIKGDANAADFQPENHPTELKTSILEVSLDPASGLPANLRDAAGDVALARPRFVVLDDHADTWGDNLLTADPEFGTFALQSIQLIDRGPVRTVAATQYTFRNSRLDVRMEVREGERAVRFAIDSDWNEPYMRYAFAADYPGESALYDIPFGVIERTASQAIAPGLSFVARPRTSGGLCAIVSCGSHGFWASRATMGVTLARATAYSLDKANPGAKTFQDTGRRRVSFMLALDDDIAGTRRSAETFERTFPVLWNGVHSGSLPLRAEFATIPEQVTLASMRRLPHTIEVRLHNLTGARIASNGQIGTTPISVHLDPFGIRTLERRDQRFEDVSPS